MVELVKVKYVCARRVRAQPSELHVSKRHLENPRIGRWHNYTDKVLAPLTIIAVIPWGANGTQGA